MGKKIGIDRLVEAFKLLSNPTNIELLVLLSSGEFNPRELAKALGRDETDVSRRLRRLERAGLVDASWKRVAGRNVRMYRLRGHSFCLRLTSDGVVLDASTGFDPRVLARSLGISMKPPRIPHWFTGRSHELRLLANSAPGLTVVIGLPGMGKTSLLAAASRNWRGPVAWYTVTGLESLRSFLWRVSLYLSLLGDSSLFDYISAEEVDATGAAKVLAAAMDRLELSLVIDDFHKLRDPSIALFVAKLAAQLGSSRILIATRRRPDSLLAEAPGSRVLVLGGLGMDEARELLAKLGVELDAEAFTSLYIATQGHPLLIKLFAEIASQEGVEKALQMLEARGVGRQLWQGIIASLGDSEAAALNILVDLGDPVPLELVEALCKCRSPAIAVYKLADLGLVEEINNQYMARDIIRKIRPHAPRLHVLRAAGDWLLARGDAESLILAIRFYGRAGEERQVVKAIRKRMRELRAAMEPLADIYARELERILETIRSEYTRSYILAELAMAKRDTGSVHEAFKYLERAYHGARRHRDADLLVRVIGLMLYFYPLMLSSERAEELIREAEELIARQKNPLDTMASGLDIYYANLAKYYAMRGEAEKALQATRLEYEAARAQGDKTEEAFARAHLAIALGLTGRIEDALREAEAALNTMLPDAPKPRIARVQRILSELYLRVGDARQAYRYAYEAYSVVKQLGNLEDSVSLLALQALALLQQGSIMTASRVADELVALVNKLREITGSIKGLEVDLLAAAAAYKAAGRDPEDLVREAIESLVSRNARIIKYDAKPYIDALTRAGLHEAAEEVSKIVV